MTDAEYRENIDLLLSAARSWALLTSGIDLKTMAETIEHADAVGFILDPTKYRDALQDGRLKEYQLAARARPDGEGTK